MRFVLGRGVVRLDLDDDLLFERFPLLLFLEVDVRLDVFFDRLDYFLDFLDFLDFPLFNLKICMGRRRFMVTTCLLFSGANLYTLRSTK